MSAVLARNISSPGAAAALRAVAANDWSDAREVCGLEYATLDRRGPGGAALDLAGPAWRLVVAGSGHAVASQMDGEVRLQTGQAVLLDGRRLAEVQLVGAGRIVVLHLPAEMVQHRFGSVRLQTLSPISSVQAAPLAALIASALENQAGLNPEQKAAIREALVAFAVASFRSSCGWADPPVLRAVKSVIEERLGDADLSPAQIARRVGISVRHLHRIFGDQTASLGQWIRGQRLSRCAADLRDPAQAQVSVTEIAFRWGFSDSAHFSRSFKAQFGQAPRRYRALHLSGGVRPERGVPGATDGPQPVVRP